MKTPLVTAGVGATAGSVAALVQWIFSSYGKPVPVEVLPVLTGIFMYVGHYVEAWVNMKFGPIVDPVDPAPVVLPTQVK
jgi:hypothetical protein